MRQRSGAALAALILSTGCSLLRQSDKAFVADAAAERTYQEDRYERACVPVGPATCPKMQAGLNLLERHEPKGCDTKDPNCKPVGLIPLANKVQQIGKLPDQERKELSQLIAALRSLP